jgi:hypothetical protein
MLETDLKSSTFRCANVIGSRYSTVEVEEAEGRTLSDESDTLGNS